MQKLGLERRARRLGPRRGPVDARHSTIVVTAVGVFSVPDHDSRMEERASDQPESRGEPTWLGAGLVSAVASVQWRCKTSRLVEVDAERRRRVQGGYVPTYGEEVVDVDEDLGARRRARRASARAR